MQAPFSPDTVFRQSNRISSGSTIRKDGSLHRKSGSHRWQSAVADRYSQPARRYSCFGRVVQLDRADGTNSPLFTISIQDAISLIFLQMSILSTPTYHLSTVSTQHPQYPNQPLNSPPFFTVDQFPLTRKMKKSGNRNLSSDKPRLPEIPCFLHFFAILFFDF